MKWLLITTLGTNPGDEFVRIGIQRLIREVDPSPTFDLLNKENPEHWTPREFDKAVVCGMPLFWSLPDNDDPRKISWWEPLLRGWVSEKRKNFLVLGAGVVHYGWPHSPAKYTATLREVAKRAWAVTVRQPVLYVAAGIFDSVCPSAFCLERPQIKRDKLCNLMIGGGHFPYEPEQKLAQRRLEFIPRALIDNGFIFVAHNEAEEKYALTLGWPTDRVRCYFCPEGYLNGYSRAACFFGNRLHGAAVCASRGVPVWGLAYDCRIQMVHRLGGRATNYAGFSRATFMDWVKHPQGGTPTSFSIDWERGRLTELLKEFSEA